MDSDLDYETRSRTMNWPCFLLVESGNDTLPVTKLSPCAADRGFQAQIPGRLRSIKLLRNSLIGGVWHEKAEWPSPQVPEISRQAYESQYSPDPEFLVWCHSLPWSSWHDWNGHTRWVEWAGSDIGQACQDKVPRSRLSLTTQYGQRLRHLNWLKGHKQEHRQVLLNRRRWKLSRPGQEESRQIKAKLRLLME